MVTFMLCGLLGKEVPLKRCLKVQMLISIFCEHIAHIAVSTNKFNSEFGGQIVGLIPLSLSAMTMKFTQIFILEERLIEII